jgi:hypothetical protein
MNLDISYRDGAIHHVDVHDSCPRANGVVGSNGPRVNLSFEYGGGTGVTVYLSKDEASRLCGLIQIEIGAIESQGTETP